MNKTSGTFCALAIILAGLMQAGCAGPAVSGGDFNVSSSSYQSIASPASIEPDGL